MSDPLHSAGDSLPPKCRIIEVRVGIGLARLAACIGTGDILVNYFPNSGLATVLRESLLIGGWVAMWRPLEIFLYDWWPIRSEAGLSNRLSAMPVRIVYADSDATDAWRRDRRDVL